MLTDGLSKALTWDALAEFYDKEHGGSRPARTLPMDTVFDWAARQKERFCVGSDGTIHLCTGQKH